MKCLVEFLSEEFQNKLRLLAQSKSERYEQTLKSYKEMYLAHLRNILQECNEMGCQYERSCEYIRGVISKIDTCRIDRFLEELNEIYKLWIDAHIIDAVKRFNDLMENNKMYDFRNRLDDSRLFFKGRISQQVLTSWDMFHIPFNKRYLINNQRYSLTGQPLLYIGSSVLDVVKELGVEDLKQLKISSVKLPENMKLYDLRSNIYDELYQIEFDYLIDEDDHEFNESYFFRMLLSSVCSFQKRQELSGFSFCEEYVLPQLLAQIVKNSGYEGIKYYSTKKYNLIFDDDTYYPFHNLSYKENIAIFTKVDYEHVYDRELYNRLEISVPIDIEKVEKVSLEDLRDIKNEIMEGKDQKKVSFADKMISAYERTYPKMRLKEEIYDESIRNIHLYLLYMVLNEVLV